jgi:hypothetical protein
MGLGGSSLFVCVCKRGPLRAGRVKTTENRLNLHNFNELQLLVKLTLETRGLRRSPCVRISLAGCQ